MKKLIVANFKMNEPNLKNWSGFKPPKGAEVVICPSFLQLNFFNKIKNGFKLGAQDLFWENLRSGGAYTGEISANMLKNSGVEYVIVGHSERRKWLGESDEIINKKLKTALAGGLKAILCVGEPKEVRKHGLKTAKNFVRGQLKKDLLGIKKSELKNITIAYEPIWAIGTGTPDKPNEAEEMANFIKTLISVKVLYGGSVNSKNSEKFLSHKDIDGALVGGASLDPKEFKKIASIGSH